MVIDDYAHHPTAIRETLYGLKARYPQRRLWAIYEPKSNTARRNIHQNDYVDAFADTTMVRLVRPFKKEDRFRPEERLDLDRLITELRDQGVNAHWHPEIEDLLHELLREGQEGDLFVFMSSSSFEGAQGRILTLLNER